VERKCFAWISIRGPYPEAPPRDIELGEFHAVWKGGVSIGSDPDCTIVLPELAPVEVRVVGASNHKLLYRLPQGTSLPLPPVIYPVGRYDERVDSREFRVGPYFIRFHEVYREK
jgi:hypothetical protein